MTTMAAYTYVNKTTGEVVIDCIANSDLSKGPEIPLWDCPCRECTQLDWEALDDETQADYGSLREWRRINWSHYYR